MPFFNALGSFFSTIVLDPTIPSQSATYKKLYEDIKARTIALSTTAPTRVINEIYFYFIPEDGVFALVFNSSRTLIIDGEV